MTNKEAREYFEQKMDEMLDAMMKLQDAWFCVEEADEDADAPYNDEYPFETDLGEVISKVMIWQSACQRENKRVTQPKKWHELDIPGWWTEERK